MSEIVKTARKQGKSNRKHGRAARSPAMKRYNAERRDLANKVRHVARALRQRDKARRKRLEREHRRQARALSSLGPVPAPTGQPGQP